MASGDTLLIFSALANEPPSTIFATLDTRNSHPILDFDDAANEEAVLSAIMPQQYGGGGLDVLIHYAMTSATALTIDWDAQFERIGDGQQNIGSDGFAAVQSTDNTTVPGTAGLIDIVTIAFTSAQIDGILAGEGFRLKIIRDAVADDAAGDAELRWVEIREN